MKKHLLFVPVLLAGLLASCGNQPGPDPEPPHTHTFATEWTNDSNQHWHAATCGHDVKSNLEAHNDTNGDGKCDVCNYIMYSPEVIKVKSISLDSQDVEIEEGKTYQLTATVLPENAYDKSITWDTTDNEIATINNGKITAISAGNCTISATTNDGGFVASCDVVVSEKVDPEPDPVIETAVDDFDSYDHRTTFKNNDSIDDVDLGFKNSFLKAHKADGAHDPAYCIDGKISSIRLYPNNTFELRNNKGNITKVEFEFETDHDTSTLGISSNVGSYDASVWTGSSKNIVFTIADAAGGKRAINKLHVTYQTSEGPHEKIDLGVKTVKEVKEYIVQAVEDKVFDVNQYGMGVDSNTIVTIKGLAMAKISLVKSAKDHGYNLTEPNKVIIGDATDAIAVATKTSSGTLYEKVSSYQMKQTSRYSVTGHISMNLGTPELICDSFTWDQNQTETADISKISKSVISLSEFYTKANEVNYNISGYGYGDTYTLKGLTCYYSEADGQGKTWYNFTDGTQNIRVNAYNIDRISVGRTYDVTGMISLASYSPIIVAFEFKNSDATPVDLNDFYKTAEEMSIKDLKKINYVNDTDNKYPDMINNYSKIYKVTGYLTIVEENQEANLYIGISDTFVDVPLPKGQRFITGKGASSTSSLYDLSLIKNDKFWNFSDRDFQLNPYNECINENVPVTVYYTPRQSGFYNGKMYWEILLIPQSMPVPVEA